MDKFLLRVTVVFTSLYFICVFVLAWNGIEYFNDAYIVLFEICGCRVMSSQGKYHCKYMKYTAYGLTFGDALTRLDSTYDFLPYEAIYVIPASMIAISFVVPFILALRHFYKVQQLKHKKHEFQRRRTAED